MDKDCMASPGAKIVAIALYYIVHALQSSTERLQQHVLQH